MELASIKRRRNTLARVLQLPVELLVQIIRESLPEVESAFSGWQYVSWNRRKWDYFASLYRLMQVSKRWGEIVKDTAQLWAVMDSRYPHPVWTTALARSGTHPLIIFLTRHRTRTASESSHTSDQHRHILQTEHFCNEIMQNVHRWCSAELILDRHEHLVSLERSDALRLKRLQVEFIASGPQQVLNLLGGRAPELLDLDLSGLLVDWNSPVMSGLRSLQLSTLLGPSLSRMLTILGNCPNLETLTLTSARFRDAAAPPSTVIHLPLLKSFRIDDIEESVTSALFESINAPDCLWHYLGCGTIQARDSISTTAFIKHVSPPMTTYLAETRRLKIHSDKGGHATYIDITVGDDDGTADEFPLDTSMSLRLQSLSARAVFLDLIAPIIESIGDVWVQIRFSSSFHDLSLSDSLQVLQRFNGIEVLRFDNFIRGVEGLLEGLSRPVDARGGCWLCPKLHTLRLEDCRYRDCVVLLRLVERRTTAAQNKAGVGGSIPALLRHFEISGRSRMDHDTFGRISAVLGEAAEWNPDSRMYESDVGETDTDEEEEGD